MALGGCFLFINQPPVAAIACDPVDGTAPLTVAFDATGSSDTDGALVQYRWNFGDGATGAGARIDHTFVAPGAYTVTLTVRDNRSAAGETSVDIVVRQPNVAPVASFSITPSPAFPQQTIRFDATASYDPDGQIVSYAWTFGDGTTGTGALTAHRYDVSGTYDVTLEIRDDAGAVQRASVRFEVTQQPSGSGFLSRHYEWVYDGQTQRCDLTIPQDLYAYYRSQPRMVWTGRDYDEYVLNPLDDPYLAEVAEEVSAPTAGDYHATAENALYFVQNCIRYVYDPLWFEYPRYPIETLTDGIGDCEDTAILYASLIRTLGHGALLVTVDTDGDTIADHMVAFVPVGDDFVAQYPSRSYWTYQGKTYAFAETAVEGGYVPLGVDPWGLAEDRVETIYDVSRIDRAPKVIQRRTP